MVVKTRLPKLVIDNRDVGAASEAREDARELNALIRDLTGQADKFAEYVLFLSSCAPSDERNRLFQASTQHRQRIVAMIPVLRVIAANAEAASGRSYFRVVSP